ncbi:unnamed protein product [Parnassius apollo]|uniref:(apollo) hypothetical protein n=1 Tax=Parnassius apollo TaxID=110799 RepID=A0A8S3X163_PARAO|nr:unnamed protein product [Parnassius apollo]
MSLQRTPPNVFSSDGDIPASVKKISGESFITTRKRKQIENDKNDTNVIKFEEKFDNQMQIWNKTISDCIANSIATAVNTALKGELSKITSALSELNDNVLKLNMDTINLNKSLHEVNTRLCEIEKSLSFSNERQDLFDSRLKTVEQNISQYNGSITQIQLLENKIHTMEQQARQCNVEIANIPDRRDIPNSVHYDGTEADSPEGICNLFSSFFHSVFQPTNVSDSFCIDHIDDIDNGMLNDTIISDIQLSKADVLKELKALDII